MAEQLSALQLYVETLEVAHSDFEQRISRRLGELRKQVAELQAHQEIPWTTFDVIGRAVLRVTVGAVLGGLLGAPALAYLLGDPLSKAFIEAAIGGAAGSAAGEVSEAADRRRP